MLTETKLREIIQSIILEKSGFRINPFSRLLSGEKEEDISSNNWEAGSYNIDSTKLGNKGVDLNSVKEMAAKTGLREDFVYGIQSRESAGKYNAMALNPHITIYDPKGYRWAAGTAKLQKFQGEEGKKRWKEAVKKMKALGVKGKSIAGVTNQGFNHPVYQKMKSVDPELAILGNALGLYQVLGGHLLPYWNYSAERMERHFERDPRDFSHKAFIIWVQKNQNWVKKVNKGEKYWADAVTSYYGEPNPDYTNHVIKAARRYRNAAIVPAVVTNNQTGGTGSAQGKAWKLGGRIGGGDNFDRMQCGPNNYRSAIPPRNAQFFKDMNASYGIDTVITLNADSGGSKVPAKVKQAGLRSIYIPLGSTGPSSSDWSTIKQAFDRGNVLIHCTHGADRTGAVVARYEAEKCNKNKNQAYKDSLKYGFKKPSFAYKGGKPDPNKQLRQWILAENNYVRLDKKQLRSIINEVLQEKSAFNINIGGASNTGSTSSSASPVGLGNVDKSSGNIVIAGDSQMGKNNGFGSVLRNIFPNAKATVNSSGHAGTLMNNSNFERSLKDAELVILTLGGHPSNKSSNIKALIKKIRKIAPDSQIIWIGAPPAFPPSKNNSMVSNNENNNKYWKKKRKSRGKRNIMIKGVIDAIENAKFINPYDYLTIDKYKPKGDGIHVPKGSGGFLKKLLS